MRHSNKILLNTASSYARIGVQAVATIISTRFALQYLGVQDFGLYNLIAGVIAMLSFLNGTLMASSQRFFSVAIGEGDFEKLHCYFNCSIGIHLFCGALILVVLLASVPVLFSFVFNLEAEQFAAGRFVYEVMILTSFITIVTTPFSAIMLAHEDIVVLSIADITSCIIKVLAAMSLSVFSGNLLMIYSIIMAFSIIQKALVEIVWSCVKYPEVNKEHLHLFDEDIYKVMLGYVGWNTLGAGALVIRNQGVAVILNYFFGTAINAAYGVANQLNGMVLSFATTLTMVFTPAITQAFGSKNMKRLRELSVLSSKLSFLLSSLLAIPLILNTEFILNLWLKQVPEHTVSFFIILTLCFLVMQLFPGINRAIYATGRIKEYQISFFVLFILVIPLGCLAMYLGLPAYSVLVVMLLSQVGSLISTIHYASKYVGISSKHFIIHSVIRPILFWSIILFIGLSYEKYAQPRTVLGELLPSVLLSIVYMLVFFFFVFDRNEREVLTNGVRFRRR